MQGWEMANQLGKFAIKNSSRPFRALPSSERTQGVALGLVPVGAVSAESSQVVFMPILNFSDYSISFGDMTFRRHDIIY